MKSLADGLMVRRQFWSVQALPTVVFGLGTLWLAFQSGLLGSWWNSEEYSHGPLVLFVLIYLVYRMRDSLPWVPVRLGPGTIIFACVPLLIFLLGAASGIGQLQKYSVWLFAVAMSYASGGFPLLKALAGPLVICFLIIPLPNGMELALTGRLQLVSSEIGVWFIRQLGGVVYLQGNVIDMGTIKLLVDEACSGLRYLYPLMGLGAIAAYLFTAPFWAKVTLFLATIPITIAMNSFRIAVTGLLVENYGTSHTEGFLHFFEGWVVFIAALVVLVLVARGLLLLQKQPPELSQAFPLEPVGRRQNDPSVLSSLPAAQPHPHSIGHWSVCLVLAAIFVAAGAAPALSLRAEVPHDRTSLSEFPLALGGWVGQEHRLPLVMEKVAGATDYYYADYSYQQQRGVNLYLSYYASQTTGKIPHSPLICMPGDGWTIASLDKATVGKAGEEFQVNRLVIIKGQRTLLAYYWLKQGDRNFNHETLARLDLIRSSVLESRTDGGLVRLVAEVLPEETLAEVDHRLVSFAGELTGVIARYVPD